MPKHNQVTEIPNPTAVKTQATPEAKATINPTSPEVANQASDAKVNQVTPEEPESLAHAHSDDSEKPPPKSSYQKLPRGQGPPNPCSCCACCCCRQKCSLRLACVLVGGISALSALSMVLASLPGDKNPSGSSPLVRDMDTIHKFVLDHPKYLTLTSIQVSIELFGAIMVTLGAILLLKPILLAAGVVFTVGAVYWMYYHTLLAWYVGEKYDAQELLEIPEHKNLFTTGMWTSCFVGATMRGYFASCACSLCVQIYRNEYRRPSNIIIM